LITRQAGDASASQRDKAQPREEAVGHEPKKYHENRWISLSSDQAAFSIHMTCTCVDSEGQSEKEDQEKQQCVLRAILGQQLLKSLGTVEMLCT
jgi:hypothetical protein